MNVNTINWKTFRTHVGIYKSEKIQQAFWKDKTRRSLKKYKKMYPSEANLDLKGQEW